MGRVRALRLCNPPANVELRLEIFMGKRRNKLPLEKMSWSSMD